MGFSCASTGELLAGPKDTSPPVLDTLASTPNNQVRFQKQDIVLEFDEFVEVKDAFKQVLVSPPLNYLPKVTGRGKKVTFAFHEKEELRADVTYSINFGDAIVDFREGNILSNFVFAFSTGDHLDSLSVKGRVVDAKTLMPAENVQVLFYDILEDSIVAKSKPYYAVKTNKNGSFECTRMKSDTFKIIALADKNVNLKYDLETEAIGFLDSLVVIDTTSKNIPLKLEISTPELKEKLLAKNIKNYGRIELLYNVVPENPRIEMDNDSITWFPRVEKDTLFLFYNTKADSFQTIINQDTILVKTPNKESLIKWPKTRILSTNLANNMLPGDSIFIQFSVPIDSFDLTKIKITDTLGELANLKWNMDLPGDKLAIFGAFRTDMPHELKIDSAAFYDIYTRALDSIKYAFRLLTPKQTASLEITFEQLDSTKQYYVTIKRSQNLMTTFVIENTATFVHKIKTLWPEPYTVEVIQDDNNNQKWDPADYWQKRQAEKMMSVTTEKLELNRLNNFKVSWMTENTEPSNSGDKKK